MVVLNNALPDFNLETTLAFYTTDDLLDGSPFLIFYGASTTTTSSTSASRIQAHIFSPAGLVSYPRLAVSPISHLYAAVNQLPRQEQGDDVCRGLAFSLFKYFTELPDHVKGAWMSQAPPWINTAHVPELFTAAHAALLAPKLHRIANVSMLINCAKALFADQTISWLDLDIVFPKGSLRTPNVDAATAAAAASALARASLDSTDQIVATERYGIYTSLVGLFGEPAFLPTSKLRRAPSKPGLNRNRSFLRYQKESLRREMCEVLDTEESYVNKLNELVHSVANDFRVKSRATTATSPSPTEAALEGLFPPSLDDILNLNSQFLDHLRTILEDTENDAIQDIQTTDDNDPTPYSATKDKIKGDVTGAIAVATCLLRWLPTFGSYYKAYIAAHAHFTGHLRTFMRDPSSTFSRRIAETGEQRLMSLLIEPVQRLPRYSMFIDNIIKQLPIRHPAMTLFLKARDVISEICAREENPVAIPYLIEELKQHTSCVPADFPAQGRFITAVDVSMLLPHRNVADSNNLLSCPAVLLLFTDTLMVLRRVSASGIGASSLRTRLDNALADPTADKAQQLPHPLEYIVSYPLSNIDITEMDSGKKIQVLRRSKPGLVSRTTSRSSSGSSTSMRPERVLARSDILSFGLLAQYDGRASRFLEEVVKARVEWRFSESERDSSQWEVRSSTGPDLNLFSALCESGNPEFEAVRASPSRVHVLVDYEKQMSATNDSIPLPEDFGADILVLLSLDGEDKFTVEVCLSGDDETTTDRLHRADVIPVLVKRLSNILKLRSQLHTCVPSLTLPLLLRNKDLLLALPTISDDDRIKLQAQDPPPPNRYSVSRPTSPVKMLTNLFAASVSRESGKKARHHLSRSVILTSSETSRANIPSQVKSLSRPSSKESPSVQSAGEAITPTDNPKARLEATFTTYILALHSRKGNVVGRTVQNRSQANELDVNELYNTLLEEPSHHQIAAQCSVDVLFAAFEKFVNFAWVDTIGPIVSKDAAQRIQTCFEQASHSTEFISGFREIFFRLLLENQRAFRGMVSLLADLLDGTNNDSDRGILTASFAEILIASTGTNPYDFISIIDRFMEDFGSFFSPQRPLPQAHSSMKHTKMASQSSSGMGSLTSNTSIRKRFGFGLGSLSRDNHKLDQSLYGHSDASTSGLGSVWRSLSKNKTLSQGIDQNTMQPVDRNGSVKTSRSANHSPTKSMSKGQSLDLPRVLPAASSVRSTGSDYQKIPDTSSNPSSATTPTFQGRPIPPLPARSNVHERPTVLGAFTFEHNATGESMMDIDKFTSIGDLNVTPKRRTKRRSSVSDVRALRAEANGQNAPKWDDDPLPSATEVRSPNIPSLITRSPAGIPHVACSPAMPSPLQPRSPSKKTSARSSNIPISRSGITSPIVTRTGSPFRNPPPDSPLRLQRPGLPGGSPNRKENMPPPPFMLLSPGMSPMTSIPRLPVHPPNKKSVGDATSNLTRVNTMGGPHGGVPPTSNLFTHARHNSASAMVSLSLNDRNSASNTPLDRAFTSDSRTSTPEQHADYSLISKGGPASSTYPSWNNTTLANPPRKLKMQSPTKLRERLQTERQALQDAETTFQSELDKITAEIHALDVEESIGGLAQKDAPASTLSKALRIKQRRVLGGKVVPVENHSQGPQFISNHPRIQALETRISGLDGRIRSMTMPMQQALASLSKDFDSSLQVSEARARNLDKLYHDALADIDILHTKFNNAINEIVKSFAAASDASSTNSTESEDSRFQLLVQEEAARRLDLVDEVERLRRENARLNRELSGLKAQMRP